MTSLSSLVPCEGDDPWKGRAIQPTDKDSGACVLSSSRRTIATAYMIMQKELGLHCITSSFGYGFSSVE